MSEQETDLDTAIQLFQLVETFDEYEERLLGVLNKCHTQEELDKAKNIVDEKKKHLMENNEEFKAEIDRRKQEAKMRADESRAVHRATMAEVESKANRIHSESMMKAEAARAGMRSGVDDWVARTKFKTVDPEELERKSEEELWCPICRERDTSRNIVNNHPTCMKDMHRLVPRSKLKDYNRSYRRAWKGKKRK